MIKLMLEISRCVHYSADLTGLIMGISYLALLYD